MDALDLRNLACPEPVIRTKRALDAHPGATLTLLLNNAASRVNVTRMATSLGAAVECEDLADGEFRLTVAAAESGAAAGAGAAAQPEPERVECTVPAAGARPVVFVRNRVLGHGDGDLGRILMKAFLKTLRDADPLPASLLFINAGVHLTRTGSEELATLRELEAKGVEILSCGTCLDFYGTLDDLEVGIVGNMFDIVDRLSRAPKVIIP